MDKRGAALAANIPVSVAMMRLAYFVVERNRIVEAGENSATSSARAISGWRINTVISLLRRGLLFQPSSMRSGTREVTIALHNEHFVANASTCSWMMHGGRRRLIP